MTSIIKVDNLQNQCGANIISESANVITIGASGDTVTLAAGASQSGFGRSGSVNWDTTPKTTSPVTAVSGNGYFIDTTSGAITINLPSTPSAGDIVAIADYNGTAFTNNITIGRNSSDINGSATDLTITQNYSAVTLVYVDATSGWRSVDSSSRFDIIAQPEYVAATGGTITTSGNFKIHTFTGPGTFTVTSAGNPLGSTAVDYLVVAGGGAGGNNQNAGGGGAGGYRTTFPSPGCNAGSFPISVQGYPITVGAGGASVPTPNVRGASGNPSIFSTITSTGGGGGGGAGAPVPSGDRNGNTGGSGGGGGLNCGTSGAGNTPPTSPSQGNNGGNSAIPSPANAPGYGAGGGGGAGAVGGVGTSGPGTGAGGAGSANSITGSPVTYAGGGGGGNNAGAAPGGAGGGGAGGFTSVGTGTVNTGGGGGGSGGSSPVVAGSGGSGIVVIRYKFQ